MKITLRPSIGRAAVGPTLRGQPLALALTGPVIGVVVLVCARWLDATDLTGPLVGAAILTVCTLGYTLDDAAAVTLASSPVTVLARRLLASLPIVVVMGAAWWIEVQIAGQVAPLDPQVLDRAVLVLMATAAVALGSSAFGAAKLDSTAGGTVGLLGTLTLASVLFMAGPVAPASWRIPSLLPDPYPERWWWLIAVALAGFVWFSRDPARSGLRRAPRSVR